MRIIVYLFLIGVLYSCMKPKKANQTTVDFNIKGHWFFFNDCDEAKGSYYEIIIEDSVVDIIGGIEFDGSPSFPKQFTASLSEDSLIFGMSNLTRYGKKYNQFENNWILTSTVDTLKLYSLEMLLQSPDSNFSDMEDQYDYRKFMHVQRNRYKKMLKEEVIEIN